MNQRISIQEYVEKSGNTYSDIANAYNRPSEIGQPWVIYWYDVEANEMYTIDKPEDATPLAIREYYDRMHELIGREDIDDLIRIAEARGMVSRAKGLEALRKVVMNHEGIKI